LATTILSLFGICRKLKITEPT